MEQHNHNPEQDRTENRPKPTTAAADTGHDTEDDVWQVRELRGIIRTTEPAEVLVRQLRDSQN